MSFGHGRQSLHCSHLVEANLSSAIPSIFLRALVSSFDSFSEEFLSFLANSKSSIFVAPRDKVVIPFANKNLYASSNG